MWSLDAWGIVRGSFGDRSEIVRGSFGDRSGIVRGSFGDRFGDRSRSSCMKCVIEDKGAMIKY